MHSIDEYGNIYVDLDNSCNSCHFTETTRHRKKIEYLIKQLDCPVAYFSICMNFKNGQRYYISNLYAWSITYHSEGLFRGDIDHQRSTYAGKEFFIQREIRSDLMQDSIIKLLESNYKLFTVFAMVRQCAECDFIIEIYSTRQVDNPVQCYYNTKFKLEIFISKFIDALQPELMQAMPNLLNLRIIYDKMFRQRVLTKQTDKSIDPLSSREIECLRLVAAGMGNKEIANQLCLSIETINTHTKSIRRKLCCKNIAQAISTAYNYGLL